MKVQAIAKDTGISPRKVRLVAEMVRGKKVAEALTLLQFIPTPTAQVVAKVVKSAAANAENNFQLSPAELKIADILVNKARTLKRYQPQARGRASPILKRASHITVIVAEPEV